MAEKTVYVGMCADYIHHAHVHIINIARSYGVVTVGLLTDSAIASYKRVPMLTYDQRKIIMENIVGVSKVIPQDSIDYTANLRMLKPDFVVHADDWVSGPQKGTRTKVIEVLREWGGQLIEVPYTQGISSTLMIDAIKQNGVSVEYRRKLLRRLLSLKKSIRVLEAHDGLSASIVESSVFDGKSFDALWLSSFTDSLAKGKPDNEVVDFSSRLTTLNELLESSTKPIIVDGDTGGSHFDVMVKTLERLGASGVVIEDKLFPKVNSLILDADQVQVDPAVFCDKIRVGKQSLVNDDFMIFARVESLIANKSVDDALERAYQYVEAGADGIMIHSNKSDGQDILCFIKLFRRKYVAVPLMVAPTTYYRLGFDCLSDAGANIVLYANHLVRSSLLAMSNTAKLILSSPDLVLAEQNCYPLSKTLRLMK
jgi:phosphoenolpyruvate phosphomutase / 2-hydroxyethylphosphonate cytidylyltransferase